MEKNLFRDAQARMETAKQIAHVSGNIAPIQEFCVFELKLPAEDQKAVFRFFEFLREDMTGHLGKESSLDSYYTALGVLLDEALLRKLQMVLTDQKDPLHIGEISVDGGTRHVFFQRSMIHGLWYLRVPNMQTPEGFDHFLVGKGRLPKEKRR